MFSSVRYLVNVLLDFIPQFIIPPEHVPTTQPSHLAVIDKITVLRVKSIEKLLKLAADKGTVL